MRLERGGTKKLIVAFHFQFANQATWKCDTCRAKGLEINRHCGWLGETVSAGTGVIWARNQVGVTTCPVSYITAESVALLEQFHVWKLFGSANPYCLPARVVDAIFILENERRSEIVSGNE